MCKFTGYSTYLNGSLNGMRKTANETSFKSLMKNNEIWLITSNKNGTSDSGMWIMSMYNNTVYKTEIINNNFKAYANEFGSVEILYDGNQKGVYSTALRLFS